MSKGLEQLNFTDNKIIFVYLRAKHDSLFEFAAPGRTLLSHEVLNHFAVLIIDVNILGRVFQFNCATVLF